MSEFTDKFKKVGALWTRKENKPGFSGKINERLEAGTQIMAFPNKYAANKENAPAYELWIEKTPAEKEADSSSKERSEYVPF
jgi:hypothetical protein